MPKHYLPLPRSGSFFTFRWGQSRSNGAPIASVVCRDFHIYWTHCVRFVHKCELKTGLVCRCFHFKKLYQIFPQSEKACNFRSEYLELQLQPPLKRENRTKSRSHPIPHHWPHSTQVENSKSLLESPLNEWATDCKSADAQMASILQPPINLLWRHDLTDGRGVITIPPNPTPQHGGPGTVPPLF